MGEIDFDITCAPAPKATFGSSTHHLHPENVEIIYGSGSNTMTARYTSKQDSANWVQAVANVVIGKYKVGSAIPVSLKPSREVNYAPSGMPGGLWYQVEFVLQPGCN